jgi:fatty acid desaturase
VHTPTAVASRPETGAAEAVGQKSTTRQSAAPDASADYRALVQRVRAAGLLRRRPWYYAVKITLTIAGFVLGWIAFFFVGSSWATLGIAVILGVMFTQVVFLGHDAGHQQISGSRRVNRFIGLVVGNALTGLSFGWWVPKHNAHHAYPNQVGRDPDLGGGLVAFTVGTSLDAGRDVFIRIRARLQVWLFLVVLLLQGLGLHVTSGQSIYRRRRNRMAMLEGLLLVGNASLYLAAVFSVLSLSKAFAFIAVQQGVFGLYLGCSFAPNHKGMTIVDRDARLPFVDRQVTTARNVMGGRFTTLVLGGLNYQIEHHLFPAMPRPNLAKAQGIVRSFCAEKGLPYRQERLVASYREAVRHLQGTVADPGPILDTAPV